MIYLELFWGFLKVGLFSFGGAYGAIPLIREVVLSYGWLDDEAISYMIGVSESTPGPIMVNLATYVGSSRAGVLGAAVATLAVVLPAFVIILLLMAALKHLLENRWVQQVLRGLEACVAGIILATGLWMLLERLPAAAQGEGGAFRLDWRSALIAAILGAILIFGKKIFKRRISPIVLISVSAVLGAGLYAV